MCLTAPLTSAPLTPAPMSMNHYEMILKGGVRMVLYWFPQSTNIKIIVNETKTSC